MIKIVCDAMALGNALLGRIVWGWWWCERGEGREECLQMDVWRGNLISRWCNKTETS